MLNLQEREAELQARYITRLIPETWISCEQENLDMCYILKKWFEGIIICFFIKKEKNASS